MGNRQPCTALPGDQPSNKTWLIADLLLGTHMLHDGYVDAEFLATA